MKLVYLWMLLVAAEPAKVDDAQRAALLKKFPEHEIAGNCSAKGLGKPGDAAIALYDKTGSRFRITWTPVKGEIKEVDTVPQSGAKTTFELRCMDADEALQHVQSLSTQSSVHSYLKVPKGASLLCYFSDELSGKCWAMDAKTGALVEVGGWDT